MLWCFNSDEKSMYEHSRWESKREEHRRGSNLTHSHTANHSELELQKRFSQNVSRYLAPNSTIICKISWRFRNCNKKGNPREFWEAVVCANSVCARDICASGRLRQRTFARKDVCANGHLRISMNRFQSSRLDPSEPSSVWTDPCGNTADASTVLL